MHNSEENKTNLKIHIYTYILVEHCISIIIFCFGLSGQGFFE